MPELLVELDSLRVEMIWILVELLVVLRGWSACEKARSWP